MDTTRPLRDVFADLAHDEEAHSTHDVLRVNGHPDLPDGLVAEAVGTYADTAPIEVAQHLSPYVMAHSPVPLPDLPEVDAAGWLDVMATAPIVNGAMPIDPAGSPDPDLDDPDPDLDDSDPDDSDLDAGPGHEFGPDQHSRPDHDLELGDAGLDFGHGTPADGVPPADRGDLINGGTGVHDGDPSHLEPSDRDAGHLDAGSVDPSRPRPESPRPESPGRRVRHAGRPGRA